jgi:nicotinate-nucleotide adenylyltransferase
MAPLAARFASALEMARHAPIRVTAIERELGTVYTAETLDALLRRFPQHDFLWLMGADNLAQFHLWRDWRSIAQSMVIAVATRPGYDASALKAPAWGWLRRFVRPAAMAKDWTLWRPPALVLLSSPPDPLSATAIRAANPDWHETATKPFQHKALRDGVTRRPIT